MNILKEYFYKPSIIRFDPCHSILILLTSEIHQDYFNNAFMTYNAKGITISCLQCNNGYGNISHSALYILLSCSAKHFNGNYMVHP